jgi:hypothetical protein
LHCTHDKSQVCLVANQPAAAISVLAVPIANVNTALSDLTYNDNLMYHYLGGVVLAVLKKWAEAEEYFEICVTAPGAVPAALQLEALKKLRLVQLISRGTVSVPSPLCISSETTERRSRSSPSPNTPTRRSPASSRTPSTPNSSTRTRRTPSGCIRFWTRRSRRFPRCVLPYLSFRSIC